MTAIAIFGATSAIAEQTARTLAADGTRFFLVARQADKLSRIAADLAARGAGSVETEIYDFNDRAGLPALVEKAAARLYGIDMALIAFGTLTRQEEAMRDLAYAATELEVNFVSPTCLAQLLANHMAERGKGQLAVMTSVAGDRGRASNYIYGAAKGGLGIFLAGLRHRLVGQNVEVLDIRLGFVDTPMTKGFEKGPLWAKPDFVGRSIAQAMRARRGGKLYVPWYWRWIMIVICHIPTPFFHRTRL